MSEENTDGLIPQTSGYAEAMRAVAGLQQAVDDLQKEKERLRQENERLTRQLDAVSRPERLGPRAGRIAGAGSFGFFVWHVLAVEGHDDWEFVSNHNDKAEDRDPDIDGADVVHVDINDPDEIDRVMREADLKHALIVRVEQTVRPESIALRKATP